MFETCFNCFQTKPEGGVCPFCGYDPTGDAEKYPLALKQGSILAGRYIVGRVLGQGGFGITYIAQDYQTKERVAIKEYLPAEFARRTQSNSVQPHSGNSRENFEYGKEQFLSEAKTLASFIGDKHIVRIFSYFEENNTAYFVMEYVDGLSLEKHMAQQGGRLSADETYHLLFPIMTSLENVQAKGIIHRDIAPDNIIITDGTAKLIDFGAARYSTGEKSKSLDVILKHGFAPKEQYLRHGRQGPYTDVYAMAATWYYAITGLIPPESIARDEEELTLPSALGIELPLNAEDVFLKAMEVSSQNRYQRMSDFRKAIEEVFDQERKRWEQKAGEEAERLERERKEREAREEAERQEKERREREACEKAVKQELEREKKSKKPSGKNKYSFQSHGYHYTKHHKQHWCPRIQTM